MARRSDIRRVLIIGSGPIVIGQACEFDYSGTQAAKALKAEGIEVVLVNSNPATIMTDPGIADRVYLEPLTVSVLAKIVERERPDALLPTVGGQTALNLAVKLEEAGILRESGTRLIGARLQTIRLAEDRRMFRAAMVAEGLEVPRSSVVGSVQQAIEVAGELGFPLVLRPSFTLGGEGGGIAYNREELESMVQRAIEVSPVGEVLVEEGLLGWKEFELEVMHDGAGNFVVVCSIENIDPMGVHTGDSVTVAPAMTLDDVTYQRMRDWAKRVIRKVGVETGGANIQFAMEPSTGRMVVIEMNPRVSRSSALASKATGFPIAKIAAKLAIGYTLDELRNDITRTTPASFEPSLDYVVVKVPRFAFKKFPGCSDTLDSQMRSVGEVMSIGRTFCQALQKAMRSLEVGRDGLGADGKDWFDPNLVRENLVRPHPARLFWIRGALRNGMGWQEVAQLTGIDPWFVRQIGRLVDMEQELRQAGAELSPGLLARAKRMGFSDAQIAHLCDLAPDTARKMRTDAGIVPVFKTVDTCAAEFEAATPYYYSSYDDEDEFAERRSTDTVVILGGGPNRIGQGIEFDCCCVHAVEALREEGLRAVMVNCNPETVSTDYDLADRLYFEPLHPEHVLDILEREKPRGVMVQFGGATPLALAAELDRRGIPILGTSFRSIDLAEDRGRFGRMLTELGMRRPDYGVAERPEEAIEVAERIGYPVLVRPSYVLGGRAMAVCYDSTRLRHYLDEAVKLVPGRTIIVDRFLEDAYEVDVDALCDGRQVVICGIMQHLEQAGIHSGDSVAVLPTWKVAPRHLDTIREQVRKLALALEVRGLMNVQFAIFEDEVYVLEVNPRASRTVPFLSKALGTRFAALAARIMVGRTLEELGLTEEPRPKGYAVKVPVFPFDRFEGFDPVLGPEMRSTGEAYGWAESFGMAFAKGMMAAGLPLPTRGTVCISVNDRDKPEMLPIARDFARLGFELWATRGCAMFLEANGLRARRVFKVNEGRPNIADHIRNGEVNLLLNTPLGAPSFYDEQALRRAAIKYRVPMLSTLSAARAAVEGIGLLKRNIIEVKEL